MIFPFNNTIKIKFYTNNITTYNKMVFLHDV